MCQWSLSLDPNLILPSILSWDSKALFKTAGACWVGVGSGLPLFLMMNYGPRCFVTPASQKQACPPPGRSDLLKCISSCFVVPKCIPVHLGVNTLWIKNCQSSHPWSCLCLIASPWSPGEPFLLLVVEEKGGSSWGDDHQPITPGGWMMKKGCLPKEERSWRTAKHPSEDS